MLLVYISCSEYFVSEKLPVDWHFWQHMKKSGKNDSCNSCRRTPTQAVHLWRPMRLKLTVKSCFCVLFLSKLNYERENLQYWVPSKAWWIKSSENFSRNSVSVVSQNLICGFLGIFSKIHDGLRSQSLYFLSVHTDSSLKWPFLTRKVDQRRRYRSVYRIKWHDLRRGSISGLGTWREIPLFFQPALIFGICGSISKLIQCEKAFSSPFNWN